MNTPIRVGFLGHLGVPGGAGVASLELFKALTSCQFPTLHVSWVNVEEWVSRRSRPFQQTLQSVRDEAWRLELLQKSENRHHRSFNLVPRFLDLDRLTSAYDIIHLHWIGSETISIGEIGRVLSSIPTVWTLHDSWPLLGSEHHPAHLSYIRSTDGYDRQSRSSKDSLIDLDRWTYRRKVRTWHSAANLVAPSSYMLTLSKASHLTREWPCYVIPNPIDTQTYRPPSPSERQSARHSLGITEGVPMVLASLGPSGNPNKGRDLLEPTLRRIQALLPQVQVFTFGDDNDLCLDQVTNLGFIENSERLRALHWSADALIVPSRIESFSLLAAEAQASGCPVVAFDTSGLRDVVCDGVTGGLAKPFDTDELATKVAGVVLASPAIRDAARARALSYWSTEYVSQRYADLYRSVVRTARYSN